MAARRAHEGGDEPNKKKSKIIKTLHEKHTKKRLIVVLERSSLESVKAGKDYELLNCDRHKHLMKKFNKNPSECRPDITHQPLQGQQNVESTCFRKLRYHATNAVHQSLGFFCQSSHGCTFDVPAHNQDIFRECLLMLFDSPLNRAGLLEVFVHTEKNVLIQISPQTRIPRTFDRFCGLIVQLLHKLSISAADGPQKLLRVVKNPVSDHLPAGCKKIGTSFSAEKCVHPRELASSQEPVVMVIGAMAHGKVDVDYTEEEVAISLYPLSAALTCAKICSGFEEAWGVN